jgi:hypothetical protein
MRTDFIEVVSDIELRRREREVTAIARAFYPDCGPIRLYRTADGRVDFKMQVTLTPENRKHLDKVDRAVMEQLGEKRGRPSGVETVQTKFAQASLLSIEEKPPRIPTKLCQVWSPNLWLRVFKGHEKLFRRKKMNGLKQLLQFMAFLPNSAGRAPLILYPWTGVVITCANLLSAPALAPRPLC